MDRDHGIIHKSFLARSCERGSGKRLRGSGATYPWRGLSDFQNSTVEWWCVAQCGSGAVWKSGAVCGAVQCVERCSAWSGAVCGAVQCVERCSAQGGFVNRP